MTTDDEMLELLGAALMDSGYVMQLMSAFEVVAAVMLLAGRFVPLAIALLAPILVNIVAFHLFLDPAGVALGWCWRSWPLWSRGRTAARTSRCWRPRWRSAEHAPAGTAPAGRTCAHLVRQVCEVLAHVRQVLGRALHPAYGDRSCHS